MALSARFSEVLAIRRLISFLHFVLEDTSLRVILISFLNALQAVRETINGCNEEGTSGLGGRYW